MTQNTLRIIDVLIDGTINEEVVSFVEKMSGNSQFLELESPLSASKSFNAPNELANHASKKQDNTHNKEIKILYLFIIQPKNYKVDDKLLALYTVILWGIVFGLWPQSP